MGACDGGTKADRPPVAGARRNATAMRAPQKTAGRERPAVPIRRAARALFAQRDSRPVDSRLPPATPAAPADGLPEPLYRVPLPDDCGEPDVPEAACCAPPYVAPELVPAWLCAGPVDAELPPPS